MHGRPRAKGPEDPERVKAAKNKALLLGQLLKEVLARRRAKKYDEESLGFAAKLLELNPEVYTVWNFRREALLPVLDAGGAAAVAAAEGELALTQRALQRNPKSYSTWHHRKWVVARRFTSLEQELKLVGMLLDADERNFHGWNYKHFVVELMGTPAERALEYARQKIDQNFSNYSAWHSRTVLLPLAHTPEEGEAQQGQHAQQQQDNEEDEVSTEGHVLESPSGACSSSSSSGGDRSGPLVAGLFKDQGAEAGTGSTDASGAMSRGAGMDCRRGGGGLGGAALVPKPVLDEEYELVKQAFYTEPEDQSGWFYHRWLLELPDSTLAGSSWAHWEKARGGGDDEGEREALLAVVERELSMCEDLLEIEPGSKWPLLTSARLKEMQQQLLGAGSSGQGGDEGGDGGVPPSQPQQEQQAQRAQQLGEEVRGLYATLGEVDPMRRGYYEDAVAGKACVVMGAARVR